MKSTFGRFGQARYWGQGQSVDVTKLEKYQPVTFKNFTGGYFISQTWDNQPPSGNFGGPDVEVDRKQRFVRSPGLSTIETIDAAKTPTQLLVHPGTDDRSELFVLAPPYLGRKRDRAIGWISSTMDTSAPYFYTIYGDILIISNGRKIYRHVMGQRSIDEILDVPPPNCNATWAARYWQGGVTLDSVFQPLAVEWSGVNNYNDRDPNNGYGFEFLDQDIGVGDTTVAMVPINFDYMAILNKNSVWSAKRTGDIFEPATISPIVGGKGCVNAKTARVVDQGVLYLTAQGLESFDGSTSTHASEAIDGEIIAKIEENPDGFWARYNPSTRRYYLGAPDLGVYVLDMLKGRWSRRTMNAVDGVPFPAQAPAITWQEIRGTWQEQTQLWKDLVGGEESIPDMVFLGSDYDQQFHLAKENYAESGYFDTPQQSIYDLPMIPTGLKADRIYNFNNWKMKYTGSGTVELLLPDVYGSLTLVKRLELPETTGVKLISETINWSGLGVDGAISIVDGFPKIEMVEFMAKDVGDRAEVPVFSDSMNLSLDWLRGQAETRKIARTALTLIVEETTETIKITLENPGEVTGIPASPITWKGPALPASLAEWLFFGSVAAPYNSVLYKVEVYYRFGVVDTLAVSANVDGSGNWSALYTVPTASIDTWWARVVRISDSVEMTNYLTIPRWNSEVGNGPDAFVPAVSKINVTSPAAPPIVLNAGDSYHFAGTVSSPYNSSDYQIRVLIRINGQELSQGVIAIASDGTFAADVVMQSGMVILRIELAASDEQPIAAVPWFETLMPDQTGDWAGLEIHYTEMRQGFVFPTSYEVPTTGMLEIEKTDREATRIVAVVDIRKPIEQTLARYQSTTGLLRSYIVGENIEDPIEIRDQCYSYDLGVALATFVECDDFNYATRLCEVLLRAQLNSNSPFAAGDARAQRDGTWALTITQSSPDEQNDKIIRNGGPGWVGYAIAKYVDRYPTSPLVPRCKVALGRLTAYLKRIITNYGLIPFGFGDDNDPELVFPNMGVEQNCDCFFFLNLWADISQNADAIALAGTISDALIELAWDDPNDRFFQSILDTGDPDGASAVDSYSWLACFCLAIGDRDKANRLMTRCELLYLTTSGSKVGYTAFVTEDGQAAEVPRMIQNEETAGVIRALRLLGRSLWKTRLANMALRQRSDGGFLLVEDRETHYGFSKIPAVSATGWYVRAALSPSFYNNLRGLKNGL